MDIRLPVDGEVAFRLYMQGRYLEAEAKCRRIRRTTPNDSFLLVTEALLLLSQGNNRAAMENLIAIATRDRANWACRLALGEIYINAGALEQAKPHLLALAVLAPSMPEAYVGLATIAGSQKARAFEICSRRHLATLMPANIESLGLLGNLLLTDQDADGALIHFEAAKRIAPHIAEIWVNCAAALGHLERVEDSIQSACRAIALAPGLSPALSNLGGSLRKVRSLISANLWLTRAVCLMPENAGNLYNLGLAQIGLRRYQSALENLTGAIALDQMHASAHINISLIHEAEKRYSLALLHALHGVVLDPLNAQAYNNAAVAFQGTAVDDMALLFLTKALLIDPDYAVARYNRGISHLRLGNFLPGWADYEARFKAVDTLKAPVGDSPLWSQSIPVRGRHILLWAEQGLGDTLQFVRYALDLSLRGADVTIMAQQALRNLLSPMLRFAPTGGPIPECDFQIPLMSVPFLQGSAQSRSAETFAYISASDIFIRKWQRILGKVGRRRIGLAFSGNPNHPNDSLRSIPVDIAAELFDVRSVDFHLVQTEFALDDIISLRCHPNVFVHAPLIEDMADTAAILNEMDLVVSVDTAILHLAGAMGMPTIGLLAFAPDWRWGLGSSKTHWYPSVNLIRQSRPGDWHSVIEELIAALSAV